MMNFTQIINILVLVFPVIGAYSIWIIQKKAKMLDDIVGRLYRIEKTQAVADNEIENLKRK